MRRILLCALALLVPAVALAKAPRSGFQPKTLALGGHSMRYQVYVPPGYDAKQRWPVVLFLHGSGERGSDGVAPTRAGLGPAIHAHDDWFPLLAVFPQAPADGYWSGQTVEDALGVLTAVEREYAVDPEREYLVGMSMGGYGTWQLAVNHPRRFAALVPVCAGVLSPPSEPDIPAVQLAAGSASGADLYAGIAAAVSPTPVWIFHGTEDPVVPVENARRMAAALRQLGGEVRFTELPYVGHDAWDPAFNSPDLWSWLLAQRRKP